MTSARRGISVEVTARCNRDCLYCYNDWRDAPPSADQRDMPTAEMAALLTRLVTEAGRPRVDLTGGEPLLRDDLFELIDAIRAAGGTAALTTDGGLVDATVASGLAQRGVAPVQVTLLAADRALHDRLKGKESFDATVLGITHLVRARVPVTVAFICTGLNWQAAFEVAELCVALGVRALAFHRLCTAGRAGRNATLLTPEPGQVRDALLQLEDAARRLPSLRVYNAIAIPPCAEAGASLRGTGACAATSDSPAYAVSHRGELRPCAALPTVIGDLTRAGFRELEAGWLAGEGQALSLPGECSGCAEALACRGGCRAAALGVAGRLGAPDPLARPGRPRPADEGPRRRWSLPPK